MALCTVAVILASTCSILSNSPTLVLAFKPGAGGKFNEGREPNASNIAKKAQWVTSTGVYYLSYQSFTERSLRMRIRGRHSLCSAPAVSSAETNIEFRDAVTDDDITFVRKALLKEKMNPLSLSKKTLVVAYDKNGMQKKGGKDENENDNKTTEDIVGFGQIRPTSDKKYEELASLYVVPNYRKQGIGTAITQNLLDAFDKRQQQQEMTNDSNNVRCCLLTLRPTIPFYTKFGFVEVSDQKAIPPPLQMEYKAGQLLSFVLGNDLVCMVRNI